MKRLSRISRKINVCIVDDHPLFRAGLDKALALEDDIVIVSQAENGKHAMEVVQNTSPDVVLLDVNLPDTNGLQVARKLKTVYPGLGVIMLTAFHEKEQVLYAIRAGAAAYSAKDIAPDELIRIVRDVAAGYYVIGSQRMTESQIHEWIRATIESIIGPYINEPEDHFVPLSPRETEILNSVTHGMSNKEIALELGISQQTVKNHMTSILQKLNVKDRTQAAVTAIRHGWVRLQDSQQEDKS